MINFRGNYGGTVSITDYSALNLNKPYIFHNSLTGYNLAD